MLLCINLPYPNTSLYSPYVYIRYRIYLCICKIRRGALPLLPRCNVSIRTILVSVNKMNVYRDRFDCLEYCSFHIIWNI